MLELINDFPFAICLIALIVFGLSWAWVSASDAVKAKRGLGQG